MTDTELRLAQWKRTIARAALRKARVAGCTRDQHKAAKALKEATTEALRAEVGK